MRVLQIINSLGTGGAEKLLLESLPLFYKEGLEVDLFEFNDTNNNNYFTGIRDGVRFKNYVGVIL